MSQQTDKDGSTISGTAAAGTTRPSSARSIHLFRYIVFCLVISFLQMSISLHLPVDSLLPESFELFLYPSFMFFMPLTRLYQWGLPGGWYPDTLHGSMAMCALDLILSAVFCLPFLFPRGKLQNMFAGFSLFFLSAYTLVAAVSYFRMAGI